MKLLCIIYEKDEKWKCPDFVVTPNLSKKMTQKTGYSPVKVQYQPNIKSKCIILFVMYPCYSR